MSTIPDSLWIDDEVVVVTGGAGQLGSAICARFDELGNTVVMSDIDEDACQRQIDRHDLENTHPLQIDVTDTNSIRSGFAHVENRFGGLDVLVNNAGIAVFTPFDERTPEEFENVLNVNVFGTFFCTQAAQRYMEAGGGGAVVNIGSIYGVESPDPSIYGDSGLNSSEVYGASKAAVVQMTNYLGVHLAPSNIRVNCVSPGGIYNEQDDEFVRRYNRKTPMGRMATVEDIVDVVVFLSSESAGYITGQNILVDGGFTAW